MARIPDAFIDDLLARTDIVEVVGARVPLKAPGQGILGALPVPRRALALVHGVADQAVLPLLRLWRARHRDQFLMNYDRLEFLDAVEELAKRRVGMEVPRETAAAQRATTTAATCTRCWMRRLRASSRSSWRAATRRAYLEGRGVDAAIRTQFCIGYAPDGFSALKDALGTDERRMKLLDAPACSRRTTRPRLRQVPRPGDVSDPRPARPRDRLRRPRAGQKDDGPKYLNSPETPLFHKGRELYGLWQVRQANQKIRGWWWSRATWTWSRCSSSA
jgi:DNA primase